MANGLGIASGLTGFAEGFAKAFTRRKEIESEQKNKADNFVTEQLIKGALEDPQAIVDSPELAADLEKRLGPQGSVFTQFLQHHAKRIGEDQSAASFLTATAPAPAQAAPAPESQMIAGPQAAAPVGTGTVLAPQPAAMVEQPEAPIAAPPKSRAQQIQERLQPGQTYTKKFKKTGESVTLSGKEGREALGFQLWQQGLDSGLDTVTAAEQAQQQIIDAGGVPPKFVNDLAMAKTKSALAAAEAAAREAAVREQKVAKPQTAEEFRTSAAQGLTNGYVVGRSLKEDDLLAAKAQGLVFTSLPDGTRIAQPREDALLGGGLILEPTVMLAEKAAQKIANRTTNQAVSAAQVEGALQDVVNTGALELFIEAPPGLAGAIEADIKAQTKNRLRLYNLRRHGDERAIALDALWPLATAFVKAGGDTGQITEPDKKQWKDFFGRVAGGTATRQEAAGRIAKLQKMVKEAQPKNIIDREGTDRANTTNSTTTTTLPYNAKVIP